MAVITVDKNNFPDVIVRLANEVRKNKRLIIDIKDENYEFDFDEWIEAWKLLDIMKTIDKNDKKVGKIL